MAKKINLDDFNIHDIPQEVDEKFVSLSPRTKNQMNRVYGSAYNFIVALYHLWFVEKQEKSEIATKLGITPPAVHIKLYDLSWHYSNDWSKNKARFEEEVSEIKAIIPLVKMEANKLNENAAHHQKLLSALKSSVKIKPVIYSKLDASSREEYIRVLYYLIFEKKYSAKQLMPVINLSHGTLQTQLRNLGLNLKHEEGIERKKERRSHNYEKSIRAGKKTRAKFQFENISLDSKNQDYVRTQLANYIYDYFDSKRYEAIIGISNTGILGTLEIDIPAIIYDVVEHQVYRFAVEYNGSFFHSTTKDENKKELAKMKGWYYLAIIETSSDRFSNDSKLLDTEVHQLCQHMKNIISSTIK